MNHLPQSVEQLEKLHSALPTELSAQKMVRPQGSGWGSWCQIWGKYGGTERRVLAGHQNLVTRFILEQFAEPASNFGPNIGDH